MYNNTNINIARKFSVKYQLSLNIYLLTKSEVSTGKSLTKTLLYWPSDHLANMVRPRSEIFAVRIPIASCIAPFRSPSFDYQHRKVIASRASKTQSKQVERWNRDLCWYCPPETEFETALRAWRQICKCKLYCPSTCKKRPHFIDLHSGNYFSPVLRSNLSALVKCPKL